MQIATRKGSVGIYSGYDDLYNIVCVLFDPAIPISSFNFIQYLFLLFFIALSVIHLT